MRWNLATPFMSGLTSTVRNAQYDFTTSADCGFVVASAVFAVVPNSSVAVTSYRCGSVGDHICSAIRLDFGAHLARACRQYGVRNDRTIRRLGHDDSQFRVRPVTADFRPYEQLAIGTAFQYERAQVGVRHDFQPDALPDAALRGIPDAIASIFCLPRGCVPESFGS